MQKWQTYAVAEGASKTISGIFQDIVGKVMATVELGCVAAILIGTVQAIGGFLGFSRKVAKNPEDKSLLVPNLRHIRFAIWFGFFACVPGTILSLYTFTLGAEFSARTLLIMASIVPGAIFGRMLWGPKTDPLGVSQWTGILLFLIACWSVLGFPTNFGLDAWVWWTLVITLSQPINEVLSRKTADAKLDAFVNNFWVGSSTVLFAGLSLVIWIAIFGASNQRFDLVFAGGSLVIGVIVSCMIIFKLLSYAGGGTIALKKVIMQSTYLVTFTAVGYLYGQPFTWGHAIAFVLFPIAFGLIDKDTRKGIQALFARTQTA